MDVRTFRSRDAFKKYWQYWLIYSLLVSVTVIGLVGRGIIEYQTNLEEGGKEGGTLLAVRVITSIEDLVLLVYFGHQLVFALDILDRFKVQLMAIISMLVSGYSLGWFLLSFAVYIYNDFHVWDEYLLIGSFSSIYSLSNFLLSRFLVEYYVDQLKDYRADEVNFQRNSEDLSSPLKMDC